MCIHWQADDTCHIKNYTLNLFSCYRPKGRSNNSSKARLGVCISPRIIWQAICLQYFYKLSCTNKVTVLCYRWLQAPATFLKVSNKAQELHIFTVKYRYMYIQESCHTVEIWNVVLSCNVCGRGQFYIQSL